MRKHGLLNPLRWKFLGFVFATAYLVFAVMLSLFDPIAQQSPKVRQRNENWKYWRSLEPDQILSVKFLPVTWRISGGTTLQKEVAATENDNLPSLVGFMNGHRNVQGVGWGMLTHWTSDKAIRMHVTDASGKTTPFVVEFHSVLPVVHYACLPNTASYRLEDSHHQAEHISAPLYDLVTRLIPSGPGVHWVSSLEDNWQLMPSGEIQYTGGVPRSRPH